MASRSRMTSMPCWSGKGAKMFAFPKWPRPGSSGPCTWTPNLCLCDSSPTWNCPFGILDRRWIPKLLIWLSWRRRAKQMTWMKTAATASLCPTLKSTTTTSMIFLRKTRRMQSGQSEFPRGIDWLEWFENSKHIQIVTVSYMKIAECQIVVFSSYQVEWWRHTCASEHWVHVCDNVTMYQWTHIAAR